MLTDVITNEGSRCCRGALATQVPCARQTSLATLGLTAPGRLTAQATGTLATEVNALYHSGQLKLSLNNKQH